ncbi:hypothetical protein Salat_2089600 [Sesamum alatum]|uniref:Uncharacterized protein n=1 Tax=Sesamum alatum TaxID=300844 RepID=A0AAE1Y098_9LAMI|nr:hypothetical protein Salat_2089600 [Sesamum alatum]
METNLNQTKDIVLDLNQTKNAIPAVVSNSSEETPTEFHMSTSLQHVSSYMSSAQTTRNCPPGDTSDAARPFHFVVSPPIVDIQNQPPKSLEILKPFVSSAHDPTHDHLCHHETLHTHRPINQVSQCHIKPKTTLLYTASSSRKRPAPLQSLT